MRPLVVLLLLSQAGSALAAEGRLRRTPKPGWALTLEGTASFVHSPSGPLGLERPDAIRFDRIEYGHEPWDAFGGRAALAYRWQTGWRAEVRAAYIEEMGDGSEEPGRVGFAPPSGGVTPFTTAVLGVGANLFRTQVNVWRTLETARALSWEVGFGMRAVSFEERATATFAGPSSTFLESDADTLFLGLQAGVAWTWQPHDCVSLRIGAHVLAGPSLRDVAISDRGFFTPGTKRTQDHITSGAIGGAFEATLQWRIASWLSITAGYEALVLSSVQRADDAFDFSQGASGAVQLRHHTETLAAQTLAAGLRFDL